MKSIRKKIISIMLSLIMTCSIFIIPTAEVKADVCSHQFNVRSANLVDYWIDYHTIYVDGYATVCYYQTNVYIAHYVCSLCDTSYDDIMTIETHTNPNCGYH